MTSLSECTPSSQDKSLQNIIFIADCRMCQKTKKNLMLSQFLPCLEYDKELFSGKSIEDLSVSVKYIWVDFQKTSARKWCEKNISEISKHYRVVAVHKHSKRGKWIHQLGNYLKDVGLIVCSLKKLSQLRSLSEEELNAEIEALKYKFSKPATGFLRCITSCWRNSKKKSGSGS